MNTTIEEIPEMYLTRKERIAIVKAGEGSDLNRIQRRLYLFNGIDFVTFE